MTKIDILIKDNQIIQKEISVHLGILRSIWGTLLIFNMERFAIWIPFMLTADMDTSRNLPVIVVIYKNEGEKVSSSL